MLAYLLNLAVHRCIGKVYLLLLLIVENIVGILPNNKTIISIVSNISYKTYCYTTKLKLRIAYNIFLV